MKINSLDDILKEIDLTSTSLRRLPLYDPKMDKSKLYEVRRNILTLLELSVRYFINGDQLDLWRRDSISQALGLFANNVFQENTRINLEACLSKIKDATLEPHERSNKGIDPESNKLNEEYFLNIINGLSKLL